jgi:Domain of unknown function (DUF4260)
MSPRLLLHLEGAAVLVFSLFAYRWNDGGWIQLALIFLLPDLSMIGYVRNVRLGAMIYNTVHTYVGPFLLACFSVGTGNRPCLLLALIWFAHIGLDRMLGFGLKYPTRFKDTHLNPARHALGIWDAALPGTQNSREINCRTTMRCRS